MGSVGESKNRTMVCASLMGQSVAEIMIEMEQAKAQRADVVEIRLDCIKNLQPQQDLQIILGKKLLPVIIACTPKSEGGQYEGDERKRLEVLVSAKELGADYIKIEFKAPFDLMEEQKLHHCSTKTILSCFIDDTTLSNDLSYLVKTMKSTGADIFKLVTSATDITQIAVFFNLLSHAQVPLITYSVGERGLISQLLGPKFGAFLVYGSSEGNLVPGLPTVNSLRKVYNIDYVDANTRVFGLISKPVSHSKGPILHNPTFRHVEYNGIYVPMFVDNLKEFFSVYSGPDFVGFSVGFPYKEAVIEFCDEVNPLAQSIGAVNTIIRRVSDGKLVGYNTDCEASITAIEDALKVSGCTKENTSHPSPLAEKLFVLVGAGGAGRALAFGAKNRGARVVVFDIDFERAKSLACAVSGKARTYEDLVNFKPEKGSILANATPLGMHPNADRIPVAKESLRDYKLVFDAVYTPRKTTLLKEAETAGAMIVNGVEMFLRQAIGQFNLFTGSKAPEEFMRQIVLAEF